MNSPLFFGYIRGTLLESHLRCVGWLWACFGTNHEFTIETVVVSRKSFCNSEKICNMTLGVLCSNSTHGFTLIILLLSGKSLWNSVDMRSVTFEVV